MYFLDDTHFSYVLNMSNELFHNKLFLGFLLCYQKSRKYFVFNYSFHLIYKNACFPKFYFCFAFYHFSCRKRRNSFWDQWKILLSSIFFNQLISCLFLNDWVFSNLAGSERKSFLSCESWQANMKWASDLSLTYKGNTVVLYGWIHCLCSLSEGLLWQAVLSFVPKG